MKKLIGLLILISSCTNNSRDIDGQFITKRTGLSLKSCTKQVFRKENDFFLEVRYFVPTPNEFIIQNQMMKRDMCDENSEILGEHSPTTQKIICFKDERGDWLASLNMDSSYCTIKVWYKDFSGD